MVDVVFAEDPVIKKPFLIAEIGINHNGNLDIAKQLIDIAVKINLMQLNFKKEKV